MSRAEYEAMPAELVDPRDPRAGHGQDQAGAAT